MLNLYFVSHTQKKSININYVYLIPQEHFSLNYGYLSIYNQGNKTAITIFIPLKYYNAILMG